MLEYSVVQNDGEFPAIVCGKEKDDVIGYVNDKGLADVLVWIMNVQEEILERLEMVADKVGVYSE